MDRQLVYNTVQVAKQLSSLVEIEFSNKRRKLRGWVASDGAYEYILIQRLDDAASFSKAFYDKITAIRLIENDQANLPR